MELGYVERRYPLIDGDPPSARSVRYDLADPLLRFWFRFVFPNLSALRHLPPRSILSACGTTAGTDLGECKWGPVRSARAVEEELERKVREYPNRRGATIGRRVFTRQGSRWARGETRHGGIAWKISIHRPEVPYTRLCFSASRAAAGSAGILAVLLKLKEEKEEMATVALAEFDAETRFQARAARGSREAGLRLLDELDRRG